MARRFLRILACTLFIAALLTSILAQWWCFSFRLSPQTCIAAYFFGIDVVHYDYPMWDKGAGYSSSIGMEVLAQKSRQPLSRYFRLNNPFPLFDRGAIAMHLPWWLVLLSTAAITFLTFRLTRQRRMQSFPVIRSVPTLPP